MILIKADLKKSSNMQKNWLNIMFRIGLFFDTFYVVHQDIS